jgi:hypothetical protein
MNLSIQKMTLATTVAALALAASSALAQSIYPTEGGRTTLTLSKAFLGDVTAAGATVTTFAGPQLFQNQIAFGISTGQVNLENADAQIVHNGGFTLTAGTKQVSVDSLIATTFGVQPVVTGLVTANGHLVGRLNIFDIALGSDVKLPLAPKNGDFYLGLSWNLDPQAASEINDALGTSAFHDSAYVGYSSSLILVPLAADGVPTTTSSEK